MTNKIVKAIKRLHRLNITKTVIYNFKMLPFKQAIKFPIFLYGKVDTTDSTGRIVLDNVSRGMIQIGSMDWHELFGNYYLYNTSIFRIQGTLKMSSGVFTNGTVVSVGPSGVLTIAPNFYLGPHTRVYCENSITIGTTVHTSWDCQIFDTNFHYMYDENGIVKRRSAPVEIGDCVWVGNRCTISKGSVIPSYCIVASNSMVNKDFSSCGMGILAGTPAKHLPVKKFRLFSSSDDFKIRDYFVAHPEATEYKL